MQPSLRRLRLPSVAPPLLARRPVISPLPNIRFLHSVTTIGDAAPTLNKTQAEMAQVAPPLAFTVNGSSEHSAQYRPAKDIQTFKALLPPVEFIQGSSSGALAVPEGKYEPINVPPKTPKTPSSESAQTALSSPTPASAQKTLMKALHPQGSTLYADAVESTWPPNYTSIGGGFNNIGNTCFLNSALQCLMNTPPLVRVLTRHGHDDPCRVKQGFCMSCGMREVLIASHKKRVFTPLPITSKLNVIAKHMRRGRQEDSHEFLRYAVDALQKSCLAGLPQKLNPKITETTWVHKIFGGRLRSRVTCRSCHHNSDTFDSILDLSLDIYGVSGLKDALKKFVAIDYLKGADKYKCEKCKRPVEAEKRFTVHQAPHVLTIHLKRFSPLGRKIGHPVRYDERISLQSVMSQGEYGPTYSLYGVICHAGGGPNSGHYFAHVKGPDGRWYEMNDESVMSERSAPLGLSNAYMLFYIREKGQALQAAVAASSASTSSPAADKSSANGGSASVSPTMLPRSVSGKNGIVASMKKRKSPEPTTILNGHDEARGAKKPFIGPQLPSHLAQEREKARAKDEKEAASSKLRMLMAKPDPQSDVIKKKIEAVRAASAASKAPKQQRSMSSSTAGALSLLSQYADDDSSEEDLGIPARNDTDEQSKTTMSSPKETPPVSLPSPSSSSSSLRRQTSVTTTLFYSSNKNKDKEERVGSISKKRRISTSSSSAAENGGGEDKDDDDDYETIEMGDIPTPMLPKKLKKSHFKNGNNTPSRKLSFGGGRSLFDRAASLHHSPLHSRKYGKKGKHLRRKLL